MVNYNNGKIYKIECGVTGLVYIGSTTKKTVAQRLSQHASDYRHWLKVDKKSKSISSFEVLQNGDYKIYLIELFQCKTKDELTAREGEVIRQFKLESECVNKIIPGRTTKEYRIDNKEKLKDTCREYYKENKDKLTEQVNLYRNSNKEKISDHMKDYYINNKAKIAEQRKLYRDKNREKIAEYQKQYKIKNKIKSNKLDF